MLKVSEVGVWGRCCSGNFVTEALLHLPNCQTDHLGLTSFRHLLKPLTKVSLAKKWAYAQATPPERGKTFHPGLKSANT